MLTAARAIATTLGASRTVIAVHRDSAGHRVLAADARLAASGLKLLSVPSRYVFSESSALVSLLDGGLARPITRRVLQSPAGAVRSAPVVVLNLETVWAVGLFERNGPDWFARQGRPAVTRLGRRLGLLPGRGACHHPDGAARNARTALAVFADDVAAHRRQWCTASAHGPATFTSTAGRPTTLLPTGA